jgi:branched-chain amino acid transport system substrate-binding protein
VTELAQALVGGLLIGGLYVAISIGFSLPFGVLDVVDLAVGMSVVLGAFAAIVVSDKLGIDAFQLLPVIFVVFGVVGWLIAPLIYRVRTSKHARVDTTAARSIQSIVDTAYPKPVTAAVVGANEPFSDHTAQGFRSGAEAAKLNIVHYSLFPPNADLAPVAQVVAAQKPDIVAVGGHDVLLVDFVRGMAATGYTPKAIIEHYGITDASFAKALGRQADGVMGISVWLPTATFKDDLFGSAGDYAKAFEQKYGSPPDYTAAGCSAAGRVLQTAVEKLGEKPSLSEDARGKLNDLIAGTDLQTFYGPIKFASEGDHFHNNTALNPMLVQIQGGQVKAIAPPDSAEAKIIYPLAPLG